MRIAIIGAGHVGQALAKGWARAGHAITLGVRQPDAVSASQDATGASRALPADAAAQADVVVLALPWAAAESAIAALGDLSGKIVIDCMNPVARTADGVGLALGHTTSGGEQVARRAPGAHVVKTLNQVGAEILADASALPHPPAMFLAGDDETAKGTVGALLTDLGFTPLDAGDLTKARLLEPLALVWINQAMMRGKGRNWALAAVSAR